MAVFDWRELYPLTPDALYHPVFPFVRTSTCSGRSKSRPPAAAWRFRCCANALPSTDAPTHDSLLSEILYDCSGIQAMFAVLASTARSAAPCRMSGADPDDTAHGGYTYRARSAVFSEAVPEVQDARSLPASSPN
jgi:hypothetical protein